VKARTLSVAVVLCAAMVSTPATALDTWMGAGLDYSEVVLFHHDTAVDAGATDHYDTIGLSAVVDLEYLRWAGGYSVGIGDYIVFAEGAEEKIDYRIGFISSWVAAKYPFYFSARSLRLWPGLGLQADYNTAYEFDQPGIREVNREPHDFQLAALFGADYLLSPATALTGSLMTRYNLTPATGSARVEDPLGLGFMLSLGLLLKPW
jgi:hypothetical protein